MSAFYYIVPLICGSISIFSGFRAAFRDNYDAAYKNESLAALWFILATLLYGVR